MSTKFDTKDWELTAEVGYRLKAHARRYIDCPYCSGRGVIGGGLASCEEDCPRCHGRKLVHDGYVSEDCRAAWWMHSPLRSRATSHRGMRLAATGIRSDRAIFPFATPHNRRKLRQNLRTGQPVIHRRK